MPKDCKETALDYLKHRARSAYEVKSRLLSGGFPEEDIEKVLRYLQELRYVDDAAYCREYIRCGMDKGRGPARLQSELEEKGIGSDLTQSALEESFDRQTEEDAAMREAQKVLKSKRDMNIVFGGNLDLESERQPDDGYGYEQPDEKTAAKIGRKLEALGYHDEVIHEIIGRLMKS